MPLDRETLDELLRLAKALVSARRAHKANPGGFESWRVYVNAKEALTEKADALVSLVELAGEGLAAREGQKRSPSEVESPGLGAGAMEAEQHVASIPVTAPPPKGPTDDK